MVLLLIVTCSLVLPLMMSIYRSSNVEGIIQQAANRPVINRTDVIVIGDNENSAAGSQDTHTIQVVYSSEKSQAILESTIRQNSIMMHTVGLVLMFVALLIIVSSYNDHLKVFANDISQLRLMGATKSQVGSIFMLEFLVVFIVAFVLASCIAIGLMYVVVNNYIGIQDDGSLSWVIFHVDLREFALSGLDFFVATAIVFFFQIKKFFGKSLSAQPTYDASGTKLKRYGRLPQKRRLVNTLGATLYQRTGGQIRRMLFAIIPSLIVVVFLFAFMTAGITSQSVPPENDMVVSIQLPYRPINTFADADITQIAKIEGVITARLVHLESDDILVPEHFFSAIYIDLSDDADSVAIQHALEALYPEPPYTVWNWIGMHEGTVSTTPGYYIMIIALAVLVLLFITVVVYVKLHGYLETQRKNIKAFYELGASKSVIGGAFGSIARRASILCIAVSFVLGMGLNLLILITNDLAPAFHPQVVLFLAAVAAILFTGFNLPVHRKLKSILAGL
jgi:ABC-type lipoprotein release transport system permease subunit